MTDYQAKVRELIRPFILQAAQPREKDLDYPVDFKTWEATNQILALLDQRAVEELESNRNQTGFDKGWIKMPSEEVDERIKELKSQQRRNP